MDQGFERLRYFQSMRLHKEIFGAIVQTNAESINKNFENIGAAVPSKYIMSSSGDLFSTIHWDLATLYFNEKRKGTVGLFHSGYVGIHKVMKWQKLDS